MMSAKTLVLRFARAPGGGPRGYVLLLVLMLSAILSVGVGALMYKMTQSGKTTEELLRRKRVFYEADGMAKAATRIADSYLRQDANTNLATAFTAADWNSITPAGYTREIATITGGSPSTSPVPNGPFEGMNARLTPMSIQIQLREPTSGAASRMTSTIVLGQVSAFQFFLFSEGYTDLHPGPVMEMGGRSHINGDFCAGGSSGLRMERVTASGGIYHIRDDSHCRYRHAGMNTLSIAVQGSCADFPGTCTLRNLDTDKDHGCTDPTCPSGWRDYAQTRWNGAVADSAHGVVDLKLPIVGQPRVQAGITAAVSAVTDIDDATDSNRSSGTNSSSRLLVDPLLPSEDDDVREQKMMFKADIRIINGVWYLRNPYNPERPGTPIWSDHPGRLTVDLSDFGLSGDGNQAVGQEDLAALHGWSSTDPPRLYSYYGATAAGLLRNDASNQIGVVSYGTLARQGSTPPHWVPGFRATSDGTLDANEQWCGACTGAACVHATDQNTLKSRSYLFDARADSCGAAVSFTSGLLQATRSGFKEAHHTETGFAGDRGAVPEKLYRNRRAKMLPMNFDLAVFQAALAETTRVGELGWQLDRRTRPSTDPWFNGIVYITNSWPGQNTAYSATSDNHPLPYPLQGAVRATTGVTPVDRGVDGDPSDGRFVENSYAVDSNAYFRDGSGDRIDPDAAHMAVHQEALPFPLCGAPTTSPGGVAGAAYDVGARFVVPSCPAYAWTEPFAGGSTPPEVQAYPQFVRLINGAHISPTSAQTYAGHVTVPAGVLGSGLSVISNLPVAVMGELNTSSDPSSAAATPWVPVLVGGDMLFHLSNAWDDDRSPWEGGALDDLTFHGNNATTTRFHHAVLGGWAVTSPSGIGSGGVHNFVRYLERWSGQTHTVRGSLLIGYRAVHNWDTVACCERAYQPPNRDFAYDEHFDSIDNQPPGAPQYTVNAVRSWRRQ